MSGIDTGLQRKKKLRKKRKAFLRFMFLLVVLSVTVISSIISYKHVIEGQANKASVELPDIPPEKEIAFEIPPGASTGTIIKLLEEQKIIKYPLTFKLISKFNGYDGSYRSGTHIISKDLKYDHIMRILSSEPESVRVLIKEGLTAQETAEALFNKKLADRDKLKNVMNTEKFEFRFLEDLPSREYKLEGYLFPDTYSFDLKAGEKAIIKTLLQNFDKKFKPEYYKRAEELKMSVDQVVILASIIEKEAAMEDERKVISSVFHNRLKSRDRTLRKLQSCATIQYIFLRNDGVVKAKISEKDTLIQDPYNTYQVEGLPPGPICSPGQASIEAALYPEQSKYLYFVAKGDGYHHFSNTYSEHQAAMRRYGVK